MCIRVCLCCVCGVSLWCMVGGVLLCVVELSCVECNGFV